MHTPFDAGTAAIALLACAQADLQGLEQLASTPGEFASLIANEIAKWSKVVRDAGIKAE